VAAPPSPPWAPNRTQVANLLAYHSLVTLVNLLNLPLPRGSFFPRRGDDVTVLDGDVARLRMLKAELDASDPAAARGFLVAVRGLLFEVGFLLHQERALRRNPAFWEDFDRFGTLLEQAGNLRDLEELRDLAYKLVIELPFYEDEARLAERNGTAARWYAGRDAPAGARRGA
jgi:hypothetical protein